MGTERENYFLANELKLESTLISSLISTYKQSIRNAENPQIQQHQEPDLYPKN